MHVPDAIAPAIEDRNGIAAAEGAMAGIEAETDQRPIRALHQRIDLPGRLDEGRAVMVEDGADSCLLADGVRDLICALGERIPAPFVERVLRPDPSGAARPAGIL